MLIHRLWTELPDFWVSVDPGDVHVGVTWWHGPVCFKAYETRPEAWVDELIGLISGRGLRLLVYERFLLRGDKMAQQQGSEFLTSQLIGAMRHICRRAGVTCVGVRPREHKALYRQREYKPPVRAHQEWASYGHGGHVKDSECLGEFYVKRIRDKGKGY